jgi:hypothetical protein
MRVEARNLGRVAERTGMEEQTPKCEENLRPAAFAPERKTEIVIGKRFDG